MAPVWHPLLALGRHTVYINTPGKILTHRKSKWIPKKTKDRLLWPRAALQQQEASPETEPPQLWALKEVYCTMYEVPVEWASDPMRKQLFLNIMVMSVSPECLSCLAGQYCSFQSSQLGKRLLVFCLCFAFWDRFLLCSPGWYWTYYLDQAGLKHIDICLLLLPKCWH